MNYRYKLLLGVLSSLIYSGSQFLSASSLFEPSNTLSKLEYQNTAHYSYLDWRPQPKTTIKIKLHPIENFSGIPMELRNESAAYFAHGKIPANINLLFSELVNASRFFESEINESNTNNPDYHFQLSIDSYHLPYNYAPDEGWSKQLNSDIGRVFSFEKDSRIRLSLQITGGKRPLSAWKRSIEAVLSPCDINQLSQPLTANQNTNRTFQQYMQSAPGQTFVAASNYLILQAVKKINSQNSVARVQNINQNELFLISEYGRFVLGETLAIYYNNSNQAQSVLPAGQVQIIKTFENQAVAYPIDLRIDQLKQGDWVQISENHSYLNPKSLFKAKNHCFDNHNDDVAADDMTNSKLANSDVTSQ